MKKSQQKQLAQKLLELKSSKHWEVIEYLENEMYERKKSLLANTGFFDAANGTVVRKDIGQWALDMAKVQGGIQHDHDMKNLRAKLLELLEEKEDGRKED